MRKSTATKVPESPDVRLTMEHPKDKEKLVKKKVKKVKSQIDPNAKVEFRG